MKRRNFITQSSLFGAGLTLSSLTNLQAQTGSGSVQADLIIKSARVYTMDGARPLVEAVAILGDRFIAAGSNSDIISLKGPNTKVIDGTGTIVTPGFIDAHSHPDGSNEVTGADVNLRSIDEIKAAMHAQAAVTAPGCGSSATNMTIPNSVRGGRPTATTWIRLFQTSLPSSFTEAGTPPW